VSKKDELFKGIRKLKDLNNKEVEFLKSDFLDEKTMADFMEKKIKLRKLLEHHFKALELNDAEKTQVKEVLAEILQLEEKIGLEYKERLLTIQNGLLSINTERKLRETYGKGGMSFLMDEEKNLK
jgi:phage/plasmid-associated DNA primase